MWRDDPPPLDRSWLVGIDLAQGGADYTALGVIERTVSPLTDLADYGVIHLERWRSKRTAYVPERAEAALRQLTIRHRNLAFEAGHDLDGGPSVEIAVDQTGVGPFGVDPLRQALFVNVTGIVIHGGDAVSHPDESTYRVPKRDIAGVVNVLMQDGRLKVEKSLPAADALKAELENFRAKISLKTGHDSYGAGEDEGWREGAHDDLVLAIGVALWLGEHAGSVAILAPAGADLMRHFVGFPR